MEISRYPNRLPAPPDYPEELNYQLVRPPAEEQAVPLTHYLWVLRRHKWRIIGFVFIAVSAVLLFSLQLTPVYESVATLEMENQVQMFELGDSGFRFDSRNFDTVVATQIEMMHSPEVAQQVIRDLHLERHPDFNPALKKQNRQPGRTPTALARAEAPSNLPGLTIRRRPETYLLDVLYRSPNPELAAAIANSAAKAFVQQGFLNQYQNSAELTKWLNRQLDEMKAKLERSQQNLRNFEKEHNVVNPDDRTNIMNLQLQRLQDELTKAQAERLRKETAYRSIEAGSVESLAITEQGEPLVRVAERLDLQETALAEAATQYGPNHPAYKRLESQLARTKALLESTKQKVLSRLGADYQQAQQREHALANAVAEQKAEVDRLSAWASDYNILKREVESQTKLYEAILKKVNETSINASIKASNLKLAGAAGVRTKPVWPDVKLNVVLALLLSSALAVGVALGADYLDRTLRSSEQVEQWLRMPVLATLPRVQAKKVSALLVGQNGATSESRALAKSGVELVEALSMLRTSLLLSAPADSLKLLLVASAAPAEGKSTVATGLAVTLAQQLENGGRVLLVDSDLRRPTVHTIFGLSNRLGLSSILEGQSDVAASVQPSGAAHNLMVLPAGPTPQFSSELLTMHMGKVLAAVREDYRYIVIDSAPLLVCADTTILSTMADGVLLVARAGETPRDAVGAALRQLRRVRANVLGLVLNQVRLPDLPGYGNKYGGYYYKSQDA